jgi:outer membrane protein W
MTSAVFAFKFFQTPERDNIFGFHCDLGLGWGWTWFERDDMLKQDDIINSRRTSISVDMAMIFAFSVGVDLKIAPDACVSLDFRYEDVDVPARWSENAVYRRDVDRFDASSGQLILSFRWFF